MLIFYLIYYFYYKQRLKNVILSKLAPLREYLIFFVTPLLIPILSHYTFFSVNLSSVRFIYNKLNKSATRSDHKMDQVSMMLRSIVVCQQLLTDDFCLSG